VPLRQLSADEARAFIASSEFIWHQRFELASGVFTPGVNDVALLLDQSRVPDDLTGVCALDIGATNGGAAFELERRGADVVAVDHEDDQRFGFAAVRDLLGSNARFVQASVYELSELFERRFDLVLFWGVLYHLRHPLLGLDSLRAVTSGRAVLETAVADAVLGPDRASESIVSFFRTNEFHGDWSNWFAPTVRTLDDWCGSCGFTTELLAAWPEPLPGRCLMSLVPTAGPPEYAQISLERPVHCSVEQAVRT
jgi:tRNA (mo5U34)-methyltransferase